MPDPIKIIDIFRTSLKDDVGLPIFMLMVILGVLAVAFLAARQAQRLHKEQLEACETRSKACDAKVEELQRGLDRTTSRMIALATFIATKDLQMPKDLMELLLDPHAPITHTEIVVETKTVERQA